MMVEDVVVDPISFRLQPGTAEPHVTHSRHLRAYPILNAAGARVATLYGVLLHGWLPAGVTLTGDDLRWAGDADTARFEREVVDGLNGAFVIVTQTPLPPRLYLDSGGQIPIVFDAAARRAAVSAHDLLSDRDYQDRLDRDRIDRLIDREGRGGWITGSLTAHHGVARLLPNHYLDLTDFTAHRHWPAPDLRHDLSLAEGADRVAAALRGYEAATAAQWSTAITLTAGFDSRLLLAASRDVAERVGFFTLTGPRPELDQQVAAELARRLRLNHRLVPIQAAGPAAQARWDRLVGHALREVNRINHPTLFAIDAEVMLTGMYGETGRCRLYRQDLATIDAEPATARFVLSRLTLPLEPDQVADIERWLDPIRTLPRSMVLDLAFNELKFGTWAMGQAPVQKAILMSLAPFAQRSVLDAFMRVPPVERGTSALFAAIADRLWPATMSLPINRYGDWRDRVAPIRKLLDPERLRRFVRDRLARA